LKRRKRRSRYARRYARREQFRIELRYKKPVNFLRRAKLYKKCAFKKTSYFYSTKPNNLPKILNCAGQIKYLRKINRVGYPKRFDGRLSQKFTKKRFISRTKL